ncbi:hypothetical protein C2845_PM07G37380 [Panicum miliaceum]|uniref:Uncharacterized protein n=1 Tax=Panicum miliaceum TaxID=4540 RepID=A0A3L6SPE4_PANMI|nr:hypothetical protein C2845_PM07G37380 [Panicum miliaceum]
MQPAAAAVLQKKPGDDAADEVEKAGKPRSDGVQGAWSFRCSRKGFDLRAPNPLLSRMKSGAGGLRQMENTAIILIPKGNG